MVPTTVGDGGGATSAAADPMGAKKIFFFFFFSNFFQAKQIFSFSKLKGGQNGFKPSGVENFF